MLSGTIFADKVSLTRTSPPTLDVFGSERIGGASQKDLRTWKSLHLRLPPPAMGEGWGGGGEIICNDADLLYSPLPQPPPTVGRGLKNALAQNPCRTALYTLDNLPREDAHHPSPSAVLRRSFLRPWWLAKGSCDSAPVRPVWLFPAMEPAGLQPGIFHEPLVEDHGGENTAAGQCGDRERARSGNRSVIRFSQVWRSRTRAAPAWERRSISSCGPKR